MPESGCHMHATVPPMSNNIHIQHDTTHDDDDAVYSQRNAAANGGNRHGGNACSSPYRHVVHVGATVQQVRHDGRAGRYGARVHKRRVHALQDNAAAANTVFVSNASVGPRPNAQTKAAHAASTSARHRALRARHARAAALPRLLAPSRH